VEASWFADDGEGRLGTWTVVDVSTRYGELALFVNQQASADARGSALSCSGSSG
jgi:hypothetical protein